MSLSFRFFSALLFLSAFLLFFIQPLVSRIILPVLGGSSAVWTTSMLFFQTLLLFGYMWAHIMIRYMPVWAPPILQVILSISALFTINYALPLDIDYGDNNTIWWQIRSLALMVGLPYFAIATNAPLYQSIYKNFKSDRNGKTPYALYAISNIGSFAALLSYPFIIEPLLSIQTQASLWYWGYIILCTLIAVSGGLCCIKVFRAKTVSQTQEKQNNKGNAPAIKSILLWCFLAFIPSSLMLSVTAHITTDIASIPLLWIIPLAFYIGSFVMAFSDPPSGLARNEKFLTSLTIFLTTLTLSCTVLQFHIAVLEIVLHYLTFLCIACLCHLKLSQSKPDPNHLTFFFLITSFGGFLGGLFNALIAHKLFIFPLEYFLTIALVSFLMFAMPAFKKRDIKQDGLWLLGIVILGFLLIQTEQNALHFYGVSLIFLITAWNYKQLRIFTCTSIVLISVFLYNMHTQHGQYIYLSRNVYGTLAIQDKSNIRILKHGTTLHGMQALPLQAQPEPLSYYHKKGPLGDVFKSLDNAFSTSQQQKVAALGLGIGSVACYNKRNRQYHFFEINQDVIDIAINPQFFTYLSSCQPDAKITLGDARVNLQKEHDHDYDLILVDTFTSDAIPTHLITKEALEIYKSKTTKNGLIAFHISNRYFDLKPVLAALAQTMDMSMIYRYDHPTTSSGSTHLPSIYAVLSRNENSLKSIKNLHEGWKAMMDEKPSRLPPIWTDDYVNIFSALKKN